MDDSKLNFRRSSFQINFLYCYIYFLFVLMYSGTHVIRIARDQENCHDLRIIGVFYKSLLSKGPTDPFDLNDFFEL